MASAAVAVAQLLRAGRTNVSQSRIYVSSSAAAAASSSASSSAGMPMVKEDETLDMEDIPQTPFRNVDGGRVEDGRYAAFKNVARAVFQQSNDARGGAGNAVAVKADDRIIDGLVDPVRTFAYGTDASFYRLEPKLVLKVESEKEVENLLPEAKKLGTPVTFRAGGTSLSGQAVTDSVLMKLSHN